MLLRPTMSRNCACAIDQFYFKTVHLARVEDKTSLRYMYQLSFLDVWPKDREEGFVHGMAQITM